MRSCLRYCSHLSVIEILRLKYNKMKADEYDLEIIKHDSL